MSLRTLQTLRFWFCFYIYYNFLKVSSIQSKLITHAEPRQRQPGALAGRGRGQSQACGEGQALKSCGQRGSTWATECLGPGPTLQQESWGILHPTLARLSRLQEAGSLIVRQRKAL